MCIAVPMQLTSIDASEGTATATLAGNSLVVDVSLVDAAVGEYVLVHAGCALEKVTKETALEILELFAELKELGAHGNR